jgi:hypothetical protein
MGSQEKRQGLEVLHDESGCNTECQQQRRGSDDGSVIMFVVHDPTDQAQPRGRQAQLAEWDCWLQRLVRSVFTNCIYLADFFTKPK